MAFMGRLFRIMLAFDDSELLARVARLLARDERPAGGAWELSEPRRPTQTPDAAVAVRSAEAAEILLTDNSDDSNARAVLGIGPRAGGTVWLPTDVTSQRLYDALAHLCQWLTQLDELEQLRLERQRLFELSRLDPLTGLANRQVWNETLAERVRDSQATGRPLVVALIDLDGFKQVNERLGLHQGDNWLVRAASCLRTKLNEIGDDGALAARWGGDEFAVLFWSDAGDQVAHKVDGLRTALAARHESRDPLGSEILTTASAGWAISHSATRLAADELFSRAEAALRAAKRLGGNRTLGS